MRTLNLTLTFSGQYVADPYWPEQYQVIEITKQSGMNRARSSANRRKALEEYLRQNGMTLAQFKELQDLAARPFHINPAGQIIIPADNFMSFMVAVCDEARAAYKPCARNQVRCRLVASDFVTNRTEPDGTWSRYATVTLGTGAKASNQRALRENPYIEGFTATGSLDFDDQTVDPETLMNAVVWGGQFVGIGASRSMGKGRFTTVAEMGDSLPIAAE